MPDEYASELPDENPPDASSDEEGPDASSDDASYESSSDEYQSDDGVSYEDAYAISGDEDQPNDASGEETLVLPCEDLPDTDRPEGLSDLKKLILIFSIIVIPVIAVTFLLVYIDWRHKSQMYKEDLLKIENQIETLENTVESLQENIQISGITGKSTEENEERLKQNNLLQEQIDELKQDIGLLQAGVRTHKEANDPDTTQPQKDNPSRQDQAYVFTRAVSAVDSHSKVRHQGNQTYVFPKTVPDAHKNDHETEAWGTAIQKNDEHAPLKNPHRDAAIPRLSQVTATPQYEPGTKRNIPHKRARIRKPGLISQDKNTDAGFISFKNPVHILSGQVMVRLLHLSQESATIDIKLPNLRVHHLKNMRKGGRWPFECNGKAYFFDLMDVGKRGAEIAIIRRETQSSSF